MALSLYQAVIPGFQQILGAVAGLLDKAQQHCAENGVTADALIQGRLAEDMFPLSYQVKSTAVHSIGAIEGIRSGTFSPDMTPPPETFPALAERVQQARDAVSALDPAEIESFIGRPMRFEIGEYRLDFTAENFLLSFSVPNFYFHATTVYDILRMKGVPLGKRDFLGQVAVSS